MLRYVYTIHAQKKLKLPEIRKLGITKKQIESVIEKPTTVDESEEPVLIAIGNFTESLSLCIAYRRINKLMRIITFYPAERGRYERKILSRR